MISLNGVVPFTPEWRQDDEKQPIYMIRVGGVIERANFEAELSGKHRAGRVFGFEMAAAFENGVLALLGDDPDHGVLIELVHREAGGETLTPEDRQLLTRARDVLSAHWPEYASLLEQAARRREIAPIVAFRRFVVDWVNVDAEFRLAGDRTIPDDVLAAIDALDLIRVGNEAINLLYGHGEERNFPQPSKSGDAPETSPSDDMSKEAGKSGASGGKKTPGSRSRRGSGR